MAANVTSEEMFLQNHRSTSSAPTTNTTTITTAIDVLPTATTATDVLPTATTATGVLPTATTATGVLPTATTATGVLPTATTATDVSPTATTATDVLPTATTAIDVLPTATTATDVSPTATAATDVSPTATAAASCTEKGRSTTRQSVGSKITGTILRWKWRIRRIKSRGATLLLAWAFLIDCSLRLTLYSVQYPHFRLEDVPAERRYSPWLSHWTDTTSSLTFALSCPISGYIAERFFGRYRVIRMSLLLLWVCSLFGCLLSMVDYVVPNSDKSLYYIQLLLVVTPSYVFKGAFVANAIPFGMDQLLGGSSEQVCAFVTWFAWFGVGTSYAVASAVAPVLYKCSNLDTAEMTIVISCLPPLLLSLGLALDFVCRDWLVREPVSAKSFLIVYQVMKYAALNQFPRQRSALTYWEAELPSRLDNGKLKYGGPFTTEQVEDVKTFWKVLLVIVIISSFNFPLTAIADTVIDFEKNFDSFHANSRCAQAGISSTYSLYAFITYSIPIYELVFYPSIYVNLPSILATAAYGVMLAVSAGVFAMTTETARQALSNSTVHCMFTEGPKPPSSTINHYLVGAPINFLTGIAILVLYVANLEFVCAQAPHYMKGSLIGLSYTLQTLFSIAGAFFYVSWSHEWIRVPSVTCGTWYYVTVTLVTITLSVGLSALMQWYRKREREERCNVQVLVEDVYERYTERGEGGEGQTVVSYQL